MREYMVIYKETRKTDQVFQLAKLFRAESAEQARLSYEQWAKESIYPRTFFKMYEECIEQKGEDNGEG